MPRSDRREAWATRWPLLVLGMFILAAGCRKPEEDLGLDLLPGDPLGVRVERAALHAYTKAPNAIRTSGLSRNLLGSYLDPRFGGVEAGIVTQLRLSSNNVGAGLDNSGLVADSVVLALAFDGINYAYGNLNAQTFRVYEVSEDLSPDSSYTTDQVPGFLPVDLVAQRAGRIIPQPFTKPFIGGDSLQPQVRIRLDVALGQRILNRFGTPDLVDNTAFLQFFKGIYIVPDNGQQLPGQQGVLYFNLINVASKATIYYRNTLEPDAGPLEFDLPISQNSVRYTVVRHQHDLAIEPDLAQSLADTLSPAQRVYAQALGGLRTVVRFPDLQDYMPEDLVLARAELVVPAPDSYNPYLIPPEQLFIFRRDTATGGDLFLPDQTSGSGGIDGVFRLDAKEYRFNITRYVQGVIEGTIPDTGVELVPGSNGISANRVVLAGPAHPDKPMYLDLIFTTY